MERPTKFLFLGASLGLLICMGGYLSSIRNESRIADLVKQCETEYIDVSKLTGQKGAKAPLICDPETLLRDGGFNGGIQKEIVESWLHRGSTYSESLGIAAGVFIIFSLPYAWYFLLRRIRELGNAITRK